MTELLRYDDDAMMTLKDDGATVNALVRRTPYPKLLERRLGEWSAVELLAHVAMLATVTRERVERCLREETPAVAGVPDGALAAERHPMTLAETIQREHAAIVELLMAPGAPDRPATHPEWGRVTAGHFAAYHATHGHGHVRELAHAFPPS